MLRLNKTANSIDTEKVKQPNLNFRNFFLYSLVHLFLECHEIIQLLFNKILTAPDLKI